MHIKQNKKQIKTIQDTTKTQQNKSKQIKQNKSKHIKSKQNKSKHTKTKKN